MKRRTILIGAILAMALAGPADALKRANGGSCDSVGTGRKTGTDDQGNKLDCLWDTCTYTQCNTSGGQISGCVQKTEYSNARDCKAAARGGIKGTKIPGLLNGSKLLKQ